MKTYDVFDCYFADKRILITEHDDNSVTITLDDYTDHDLCDSHHYPDKDMMNKALDIFFDWYLGGSKDYEERNVRALAVLVSNFDDLGSINYINDFTPDND